MIDLIYILKYFNFNLETTPLNWAARSGHIEMVAYLIKNGADPNAKDNDGYSTIHLSAMFNHPIVVAYLLAKGVDVNKLYYFY